LDDTGRIAQTDFQLLGPLKGGGACFTGPAGNIKSFCEARPVGPKVIEQKDEGERPRLLGLIDKPTTISPKTATPHIYDRGLKPVLDGLGSWLHFPY